MSASASSQPSRDGELHPSEQEQFARYLGLRITAPGEVRLLLRPEHINRAGMLLGPIGFALVDYAMGDLAYGVCPPGRKALTSNVTVHFLEGADRGEVVATAEILRHGQRLLTLSSEVRDERDRLLMTALGQFALAAIDGGPEPRNKPILW
jgi:uncharacterized protein (TIGR00369 family)